MIVVDFCFSPRSCANHFLRSVVANGLGQYLLLISSMERFFVAADFLQYSNGQKEINYCQLSLKLCLRRMLKIIVRSAVLMIPLEAAVSRRDFRNNSARRSFYSSRLKCNHELPAAINSPAELSPHLPTLAKCFPMKTFQQPRSLKSRCDFARFSEVYSPFFIG